MSIAKIFHKIEQKTDSISQHPMMLMAVEWEISLSTLDFFLCSRQVKGTEIETMVVVYMNINAVVARETVEWNNFILKLPAINSIHLNKDFQLILIERR